MSNEEIKAQLDLIAYAGSVGLLLPGYPNAEQCTVIDRGLAYLPLNAFRSLGKRHRLQLTAKGRQWLKDYTPPDPAPGPEPEPEPEPVPAPEPTPEPDAKPAPAPVVPPVVVPPAIAPAPTPTPGPERVDPVPAPVEDLVLDEGKRANFTAAVRAATASAVTMLGLRDALRPLAVQAIADGLMGDQERPLLRLTKRNANKWGAAPEQYQLQEVDV
jgi:hypothetical protein